LDQYEEPFAAPVSDTEPGMNLISVDFDIVMVNRTNERLYAKSMVALLGRKCYREFEKRDEPCAHCPGRVALRTGEAHETETTGLRDDGTRFSVRIKAHPVIGPDNRATGFIEIVEDITEQKRAENLSAIDAQLQTWLAGIQNVRSALREALRATLLVEGIDCGAAFMLNGPGLPPELIQEKGLNPTSLDVLTEIARRTAREGQAAQPPMDLYGAARPTGSPRVVAVVPIVHRGKPLAVLVVGSTVYPVIPVSLRNGLNLLGTSTGTAISRIMAEQSRGDAIADLEAVIAVSPLPTWAVDGQGRITMWNKAAEKAFGWRAGEMVGNPPPWGPSPTESESHETVLDRKDGRPVELRLSAARFRDVVGNNSVRIVVAEDLRAQKRIEELEARIVELEARLAANAGGLEGRAAQPDSLQDLRVLIVDGNESWGVELTKLLTALGCAPVRCVSLEDAHERLAAVAAFEQPFCVAVVALIGPGGTSGLGQRAALKSLGLQAPVILSSDVEVRGHEQHGIAAVITRPYQEEAVRAALLTALRERGGRC
jgi:PAS domain S-box-containing protein